MRGCDRVAAKLNRMEDASRSDRELLQIAGCATNMNLLIHLLQIMDAQIIYIEQRTIDFGSRRSLGKIRNLGGCKLGSCLVRDQPALHQ